MLDDSPTLRAANHDTTNSHAEEIDDGARDRGDSGTDTSWDDIGDRTPAVELWVPSSMFHRLHKILTYSDTGAMRFNLGDVPDSCEWGTGPDSSRLVSEGRVVEIWAVGHLKSMLFFAAERDPRPRARISLDLLRDIDRSNAEQLMGRAQHGGSQVRSWLGQADFCADRVDSPATNRKIFQDIFDARLEFRNKRDMPVLALSDIAVGDLVLVECWLVRSRLEKTLHGRWCTQSTAPSSSSVCTFDDVL